MMEKAESADAVFEWRAAECIGAEPFQQANATDVGYASTCQGGSAFAESFNPAMKLVRNKIPMQGDAYCNHRYTYQAG